MVRNLPVLTRRLQDGSQWIAVLAICAEAAIIIEAEEFVILRMGWRALASAVRRLFCKLSS